MVNFIKQELDKEFSSIGFKNQSRHVKTGIQIQKKGLDVKADFARKARLPGKRISRTGKIYTENRANRSDAKGSKI